jgi:outer membrane protein assembly factor BamB
MKKLLQQFIILSFCFVIVEHSSAQVTTSLLWTYSADWYVWSIALTTDVNNNGTNDVFAGAWDDRIYCVEGASGAELWSTTIGASVREVASIADVNNDGIADCLAGSDDDNVYCISGDPAQTGAEIWSYYAGASVYGVASLPDVSGDGIQECLAATGNQYLYCFSGASQGTGTILWSYQDNHGFWDVVPVTDVNADGYSDCFAGSMDNQVNCFSGKISISGSRKLWTYATSGDVWCVNVIPDVNSDGINDCIAGTGDDRVLCLSGTDGSLIWSYTAGGDVWCVAPLGDVNNDNKAECLAGSADNKVYCFDGSNGTKRWERDMSGDVWSAAPLSDINGDNVPDCVVGTGFNEIATISGLSIGIGAILWSEATIGDVKCVISGGDINNNGVEDVVSGSYDSNIRAHESNSLVVSVELVSFSASRVGRNVNLEWNTASELNNFGFEILKSNDGHNFEKLGFVHGHGTTSTQKNYYFVDEDASSQILFYQLNQIDFDGTQTQSQIIKIDLTAPVDFTVLNNYPNPFNASTVIKFTVPSADFVQVTITNVTGEIVKLLLNKLVDTGTHHVFWNGKNDFGSTVASGTYICSVKWGDSFETFPLTYVK